VNAAADFTRDPPAFLRHNYVVYSGVRPPQAGAEYEFVMLKLDQGARRRRGVFLGLSLDNADASVYEVRLAATYVQAYTKGEDSGRLRAVWGGFSAGAAVEAALGVTGAGIMLTPELSGCTVAFASQRDGSARFSHYNLMAGTQTRNAPAMVAQARRDYAGVGNMGVVTKEHYRARGPFERRDGDEPARGANVVGWRKDGRWTFWMQYTELKGGTRQIRNVRQMVPGAHVG
jgi:hypothetical protein